jgi:hypothetical protein
MPDGGRAGATAAGAGKAWAAAAGAGEAGCAERWVKMEEGAALESGNHLHAVSTSSDLTPPPASEPAGVQGLDRRSQDSRTGADDVHSSESECRPARDSCDPRDLPSGCIPGHQDLSNAPGGGGAHNCGCPDGLEGGGGRGRPALPEGRGPVGRTRSTSLSACSTHDTGDNTNDCPDGLELDGKEDAARAFPRSGVGRDDARTRCSFLCDSGSRQVREGCSAGSTGDVKKVHVDPCRVEAPSERSGTTEVMPAALPSPWAGMFTDTPKDRDKDEDSCYRPPSVSSIDSARDLATVLRVDCCSRLCCAALGDALLSCFVAIADC